MCVYFKLCAFPCHAHFVNTSMHSCANADSMIVQDCAAVILYTAEAATKMALDTIQILGKFTVGQDH